MHFLVVDLQFVHLVMEFLDSRSPVKFAHQGHLKHLWEMRHVYNVLHLHTKIKQVQIELECIPVGCIPPLTVCR